jgi:hypothetical protein
VRSERNDWSDFFHEPDKASMGRKSIRQGAAPLLALYIFSSLNKLSCLCNMQNVSASIYMWVSVGCRRNIQLNHAFQRHYTCILETMDDKISDHIIFFIKLINVHASHGTRPLNTISIIQYITSMNAQYIIRIKLTSEYYYGAIISLSRSPLDVYHG